MSYETASWTRTATIALIAVAATAYVSYTWSRQEGINRLQAEASTRLTYATAALFAPTDKYSYLPELVANHPISIGLLQMPQDARSAERANFYLERLNESTRTAVIYLLDTSGVVIASSNWKEPLSFVGSNYAFRPYFQNAMRHGTGSFYGMGTTSMTPGYYLSHAVRGNTGVLGVAVVKIDLNKIDAAWNGGRDEVAVTDANGVIFLSSRPDWKYRPMRPLSYEAAAQLQHTRQYDTVLKPPLPVEVIKELRDDEQLVRITQPLRSGRGLEVASYYRKSGALEGANWTINVLVPMADVDARAARFSAAIAGALAFIVLSVMYLMQLRIRTRERERSRLALERAHQALEQKHRELQALSEDLRITAITDPLTGAYNRRYFFETLPKIVSAANRHRFPLTLVTIDVDHFKSINDKYGHAAGDKVLQALTRVCMQSLREADIFARFGGEEFIMALPHSSADVALGVADRLRLAIMQEPLEIDGHRLTVTISCGVSQHAIGEPSVEAALKRADAALYKAKANGRNLVVAA